MAREKLCGRRNATVEFIRKVARLLGLQPTIVLMRIEVAQKLDKARKRNSLDARKARIKRRRVLGGYTEYNSRAFALIVEGP